MRRNSWGVWIGVAAILMTGGWWIASSRTSNGNRTGNAISRLSAGDFHSLAFSPTDLDTIYFGHHDGMMVSQNGGRVWQPASLQNVDAMALAVPPDDPRTMYAAGHNVLVKSTDGGQTWNPLAHNLPGADIHGFAVDPGNAAKVYAHVVGQVSLFVSEDGGTTWAALPTEMPATTFNLTVGETEGTLYAAAGEAGLWRSTDGGRTWTKLTGTPGDGVIALAYNRTNHRLLITTLGNDAGVYASDDGLSWSSLGLKGMLMAVASSPADPNRLVAVDDQGWVYASRDGGATWGSN